MAASPLGIVLHFIRKRFRFKWNVSNSVLLSPAVPHSPELWPAIFHSNDPVVPVVFLLLLHVLVAEALQLQGLGALNLADAAIEPEKRKKASFFKQRMMAFFFFSFWRTLDCRYCELSRIQNGEKI